MYHYVRVCSLPKLKFTVNWPKTNIGISSWEIPQVSNQIYQNHVRIRIRRKLEMSLCPAHSCWNAKNGWHFNIYFSWVEQEFSLARDVVRLLIYVLRSSYSNSYLVFSTESFPSANLSCIFKQQEPCSSQFLPLLQDPQHLLSSFCDFDGAHIVTFGIALVARPGQSVMHKRNLKCLCWSVSVLPPDHLVVRDILEREKPSRSRQVKVALMSLHSNYAHKQ